MCESNANPFGPAYIAAWERYYGRIVPPGYVVHHLLGNGPHGMDPTYLLALPRPQHTAMHNRARGGGVLELPKDALSRMGC